MSLSDMSRTISNMYTYTFNPQLVIKKHKLKVMIGNQKIKGIFILGPLFSKRMGLFQS